MTTLSMLRAEQDSRGICFARDIFRMCARRARRVCSPLNHSDSIIHKVNNNIPIIHKRHLRDASQHPRIGYRDGSIMAPPIPSPISPRPGENSLCCILRRILQHNAPHSATVSKRTTAKSLRFRFGTIGAQCRIATRCNSAPGSPLTPQGGPRSIP